MEENLDTVILRPVKEEDLELIMYWRTRADITKYMNTDPKLTLKMQKKWFEGLAADNNSRVFVIEIDKIPIGILNITNIDYLNKRCSWGYYVADIKKRSLRLAVEIELNLYDYVFENLQLNKLETEVFSLNSHVIKIHELCGSSIEGELMEHVCKNEEYYDITVMGITKNQWNRLKEEREYRKIEIIPYPISSS